VLFVNQMIGGALKNQFVFGVPPSSGVASFAIIPNVDYTFQIWDDSNINNYLPEMSSDMNAMFSFDITPVPEPSVLALAALGIPPALALRFPRRRRVASPPARLQARIHRATSPA
jgi:hypothetical protein